MIVSGRKYLHSGRRACEFEEGQSIIFAAGNCLSTDMPSAPEPYRSILLFFDDLFLDRFLAKHGGDESDGRTEEIFHAIDPVSELVALRDELSRTLSAFPALSSARLSLKLEEILLVILETQGVSVFDCLRRRDNAEPAQRVRSIVEAHWRDGLNTDEMAFLCHMSSSSFKRHFRSAYGMPPGQLLLERRLLHAAHLLRVEGRRPAIVFEEAGFSSPSAFTQSFKARFGVTPGAYRTGDK